MSEENFFSTEIETKEPMYRIVEQKGNELIIALKMEKPSELNRSKDAKTGERNGKNYVINSVRDRLPFTYQGKSVKLHTMILVSVK